MKSQAEIDEEAALWVWRLDSESRGPEVNLAFESWIAEDSRNLPAYQELRRTWELLDRLPSKREPQC